MSQIIYEGINTIDSIIKGKKILLVVDNSFNHLSIQGCFRPYDCITFSDITPNPTYNQVCSGVKVFVDNGCEMIVAVGGGSAIDVAKCIKLFCEMDHSRNYLQQEHIDSKIVIVAIPTTAGTGSESTKHAVIYYNGEKQSIADNCIIPNYAVLEPSVLTTLPVYQKKSTMLDALCQAIESWWSINSTEESILYSEKAIKLIKSNWEKYIFDNSYDTLSAMLLASNYAGRAINITSTTAAHAMSYKITSLYGLAHGNAVAICMPEVWLYLKNNIVKNIDSRGISYLSKKIDDIERLISLEYFCNLLAELGMPMPESKNKEIEIRNLSLSVNPIRLKNYPVRIDSIAIEEMYRRIIK